jgi:TusA-related sulfurtransferase
MSQETADQVLDLENEVCPYTFVKSKMAVEKLAPGQVLEIHLGNSESAGNVPRSLDLEGHQVLNVDNPRRGHWVVTVQRGSAE